VEDGVHCIEMEISQPLSAAIVDVTLCNAHRWQVKLVADEFYLAAMHQFFAVQNQAMAQAAHNQQALAKLQQGGRGNAGFIRGVGR
jgi:hypothetical protein